MIRTYVDTGILIEAFRGRTQQSARAMDILGDPNREFGASIFLRMETQAKAKFNKRTDEVEFYEEFFQSVVEWAHVSQELVETAHFKCVNCGVGAMDALHVAAAHVVGAGALITTVGVTKSIHRARLVRVEHINMSRSTADA